MIMKQYIYIVVDLYHGKIMISYYIGFTSSSDWLNLSQ